MQQLYLTNFKIAAIITATLAVIILVLSFIIGNQPLFLYLNGDGGKAADFFFKWVTQLGETIPWVTALLLMLKWRKQYLLLLVYSFVVSTILAQGIKNLLPVQPRPTKAIANLQLVHVVQGVDLHQFFSFPSGHTTTAFTVFFIACLCIRQKWVLPVGFVYALLVGYSRIYLAQHFPRDVAGGMLIAIITVYISLRLSAKKITV
ncbi:phosphatase PAP2 family protein [Parasediminibacterium sp. JCM 36343]|uniref:phosphatase PAP2 family protein n=1 Tax=Parasediminibacterium sp. JCM 36343 TaxID=3374279 RepID=UPI0039796181